MLSSCIPCLNAERLIFMLLIILLKIIYGDDQSQIIVRDDPRPTPDPPTRGTWDSVPTDLMGTRKTGEG